MALFGGLFDGLMSGLKSLFGGGGDFDDVELQILWDAHQSKVDAFVAKVQETIPYGETADEAYRVLLYNNLNEVPAVELYDGDYFSRLNELILRAEATMSASTPQQADADLAAIEPELKSQATQIQTFLREETSDLEAAKLWDSKFIKGVQEHIPPHHKKGEYMDDTMSEVMRAFRNWSSFAQSQIDMYGSQRLINATYEAVGEGRDPMEYMSEILELNALEGGNSLFGFGGSLNENANISVPNAGFFGSGFFF